MTTALDIITQAYEESGILTKTETPTNEEAQTGLTRLNRLVSSWSNSSVLIFERATENFPLTNLQISYTIGSGGDFDTVRPSKIVESHVRIGDVDYPLEIIPDHIYQSITYKIVSGLPQYINYTNEFPLATLNIYPAPSAQYTLFITSEKPFTEFATINTTVSSPPGWEDALAYNLAVRLCPIFGQPVSPDLNALAKESKAMIALNAIRNNPLQSQVTSQRSINNIYSGYAT